MDYLRYKFKKYRPTGKISELFDGEEVIRNLGKINIIPEEEEKEIEDLKAAILKEHRKYWLKK